MSTFLVDTSCIVAAISGWHQHQDQAAAEIERRLARGERLVLAGHSLVEAYAVLTRLPPPLRLAPSDAVELLEANFGTVSLVVLQAGEYRKLLRGAPGRNIIGGQIYDAVIAQCALKAKAAALITFNARHFLPFAEQGLEIVVPGQRGS